jgi:hypothetical protein
VYVPSGDVAKFCDAIELLLDDPEYRFTMARKARARVSSKLDWKPQSEAYVSVFDRLVPSADAPAPAAAEPTYVDLDQEAEFRRFVLARGPVPDHVPDARPGPAEKAGNWPERPRQGIPQLPVAAAPGSTTAAAQRVTRG